MILHISEVMKNLVLEIERKHKDYCLSQQIEISDDEKARLDALKDLIESYVRRYGNVELTLGENYDRVGRGSMDRIAESMSPRAQKPIPSRSTPGILP